MTKPEARVKLAEVQNQIEEQNKAITTAKAKSNELLKQARELKKLLNTPDPVTPPEEKK